MLCAGHPQPLLIRDGAAAGRRALRPDARRVAGQHAGAPTASSWSPGDVLVLYTDGVTDARGEAEPLRRRAAARRRCAASTDAAGAVSAIDRALTNSSVVRRPTIRPSWRSIFRRLALDLRFREREGWSASEGFHGRGERGQDEGVGTTAHGWAVLRGGAAGGCASGRAGADVWNELARTPSRGRGGGQARPLPGVHARRVEPAGRRCASAPKGARSAAGSSTILSLPGAGRRHAALPRSTSPRSWSRAWRPSILRSRPTPAAASTTRRRSIVADTEPARLPRLGALGDRRLVRRPVLPRRRQRLRQLLHA